MNPYPIFVYGTLMSGERAHALFAASSNRQLSARLPNALLYSTGRYPIAVDCTRTTSTDGPTIWGELHWLQTERYGPLLAKLDAYEGDEYRRVVRSVALVDTPMANAGDGQLVDAWVYLGDAAYAAQYPLIASGDWRKRDAHVGN